MPLDPRPVSDLPLPEAPCTLAGRKLDMKLVRGHSPQNLWPRGICLCHQEATGISDKPGVVVPREVSCPSARQKQSMAALNPDHPLSFLTLGTVFCHLALENRLLEGPTPGQERFCQIPPSIKESPQEISSGFQSPQCAWDRGQQQHISIRKLGQCLALLNWGNFSSRFYLCIYLTLLKFSCSFLSLLSAWPPPGQAPVLP